MSSSALLRRLATAVASALLVIVAGSCSGDGPTGLPPAVASIEVTPGADTLLAVGRVRAYAAVARDADGVVIADAVIRWESSDTLIARVDSITGQVTAVAGGRATIRAASGDVEGTGLVDIIQIVAAVTVTPGSSGLATVGGTQAFSAVARDSGNAVVPGVRFLWLSSDPSIATIDTLGVATAVKAGKVTVSASGRGVPAYAELTVTQVATRLAFTIEPSTVRAGDAFETAIQVEVRDAGGALVPTARIPVSIEVLDDYFGTLLWGSTTVESVGGIATFGGLWINRPSPEWRMAVSAAGLTPDTSAAFVVRPGLPASATVIPQAAGGPGIQAGSPTLNNALVRFRDAYGNQADTTYPTGFTVLHPNGGFDDVEILSSAPLSPGYLQVTGVGFPRVGTSVELRSLSVYADGAQIHGTSAPFNISATFASLSLGDQHTCGKAIGGVFCWGANGVGQLGTGNGVSTASDSVPGYVKFFSTTFTGVAVSGSRTCALTQEGGVRCWGLGTDAFVAGTGAGGLVFVELTMGVAHVCGRTAGGAVHCWGAGQSGKLGNGSDADSPTPVQVVGSGAGNLVFTQIDAGSNMTCGVTAAGRAYCWGSNANRQLGEGTQNNSNVPVQATGTGAGQFVLTKIDAGDVSTCAVTSEGNIACWGSGVLGNGTSSVSLVPIITVTPTLGPYIDVSVGAQHACGVASLAVRCWGNNTNAQVGPGASASQLSPLAVSVAGQLVQDIEAGLDYTCARTSNGIYCWGGNANGKLGIGATEPIAITMPTRIRQ